MANTKTVNFDSFATMVNDIITKSEGRKTVENSMPAAPPIYGTAGQRFMSMMSMGQPGLPLMVPGRATVFVNYESGRVNEIVSGLVKTLSKTHSLWIVTSLQAVGPLVDRDILISIGVPNDKVDETVSVSVTEFVAHLGQVTRLTGVVKGSGEVEVSQSVTELDQFVGQKDAMIEALGKVYSTRDFSPIRTVIISDNSDISDQAGWVCLKAIETEAAKRGPFVHGSSVYSDYQRNDVVVHLRVLEKGDVYITVSEDAGGYLKLLLTSTVGVKTANLVAPATLLKELQLTLDSRKTEGPLRTVVKTTVDVMQSKLGGELTDQVTKMAFLYSEVAVVGCQFTQHRDKDVVVNLYMTPEGDVEVVVDEWTVNSKSVSTKVLFREVVTGEVVLENAQATFKQTKETTLAFIEGLLKRFQFNVKAAGANLHVFMDVDGYDRFLNVWKKDGVGTVTPECFSNLCREADKLVGVVKKAGYEIDVKMSVKVCDASGNGVHTYNLES